MTSPASPQISRNLPLPPRPPMGLGKALIGAEEEALVLEVLRSQRLFRYDYGLPPEEQGAMTATLEREAREKLDVKFALAVTSGTAALEVALGALGVGPGDEVILPAWSWISCFSVVVHLGALPVLAEMDESFSLAPGEIKRLATPRTKAVLIMHYQGVPADMDPLLAEANEVGVPVLEDCAQTPGATYHGKRVGSMGAMGTYSFQFQKTITSGEGGLVLTNDPVLYERAVRMHDLGLFRPYHGLFTAPQIPEFSAGQFRMNELTAAVALAQWRKLDDIRTHCRNLSSLLMERIRDLPHLTFRKIPDPGGDSGIELYFYLPDETLTREFVRQLDARNINCVRTTRTYIHYTRDYCSQRSVHTPSASPFRAFPTWPAPGYRAEDFPRTENLAHRFVSLPIGVLYTENDARYIAESICDVHRDLFGN